MSGAANIVGNLLSSTASFIRDAVAYVSPKLGQALDSVAYGIKKGANYMLSGVEWVIDKVSHYAGKAGSFVLDNIKSGGSWIGSKLSIPQVFKDAASMIKSVIDTVSRFCTAAIESYEYYNQLRTSTNAVAAKYGFGISRATVLRVYRDNGLAELEDEKEEDEVIEVSFFLIFWEF